MQTFAKIKQDDIRDDYSNIISIKNALVKNSWEIILANGDRIIRHYQSDVITFKTVEGKPVMVLHNANFGLTTRKLVNANLPEGWHIYKKDFVAYIQKPNGETVEYSDWMVLDI